MITGLMETFAGTIASPLVWLSALILVFVRPRPWAVRSATAAVAAVLVLLEAGSLVPSPIDAAGIAVAAVTGALVAEVVLGLILPAILLLIAAVLRCVAFARRILVFLRRDAPTPGGDAG